MRIGVNTLFYIPGEVGGSETYLRETLRALLPQAADHEFVLFTQRDNDAALRALLRGAPTVSFHLLEFSAMNRPLRILEEQLHLPRAVRREGVQVLWSPGYTAPMHAPCPQVVSILDMQYKSHPEDLTLTARLATDVLVQWAARHAAALLAISDFSKSDIVHHTRASADRITVTPLAADPVFRDAPCQPLKDIFRPYVFCAAHTYPHKNVHAVAAAFARIQRIIPHHLVLLGKPRRGEPQLQQALRACDAARVHRLEWVALDALVSLYRHADLFVFPSLYEGFGLPVLEAMMAGTPVLTTRHGAIPEVAGDTAHYFNPADLNDLSRQMAGLLEDAHLRCSPVAKARARAGSFSWNRAAEATLSVLTSVGTAGR